MEQADPPPVDAQASPCCVPQCHRLQETVGKCRAGVIERAGQAVVEDVSPVLVAVAGHRRSASLKSP
jgi:hypothetical protein